MGYLDQTRQGQRSTKKKAENIHDVLLHNVDGQMIILLSPHARPSIDLWVEVPWPQLIYYYVCLTYHFLE